MKEQVPVEKLAIGMFVAELDRPWVGTPFLIQGFVIENEREIQQFQSCCKYVIVDRAQSTGNQFIRDPADKSVAPQRARSAPQARIYRDKDKAPGDAAEGEGLIGSIGRIFKSAFSGDGAPPPDAASQSSQPVRAREPVVTIYKDKDSKRPSPQEATAVREKGMSNEERSFLEQATDPDASVRIYAEKELNTTMSMLGKLSRLFKGSGEERKAVAASSPVEEAPVYVDQTTIEDELPLAQEAHQKVENVVQSVIDDLHKNKILELDKVNEAVGWMVESVVRNPDGMIWLTRLKSVDAYTYDHGLNTAIYLIAFGRHLGLPEDQLQTIGTVGLM